MGVCVLHSKQLVFDIVDQKGKWHGAACIACVHGKQLPEDLMVQGRLFSSNDVTSPGDQYAVRSGMMARLAAHVADTACTDIDFGPTTPLKSVAIPVAQVNETDPRHKKGTVIRYVVGFMFDELAQRVVLIKKIKPLWQMGKLNGVGGKIEAGETALEAMVREFYEETGIHYSSWNDFCVTESYNGQPDLRCHVHFFSAFAPPSVMLACQTMTDELISVESVWRLLDLHTWPKLMENLPWLIPMALSMGTQRITQKFEVVER
jgi:8-oxo-dGTP diphosphatase